MEIAPDDLFICDAYPKWSYLISKADASVKIFTPYADNLVNNLISKVDNKKELEISIITRIDGESFFETTIQVQALKKAIQRGCKVFHLSGLHAKVLVIDNKIVSVGSQNFTYRGRKNREISVISEIIWDNHKYYKVLEEWEEDKIEINESLLDALLIIQDESGDEIDNIKSKIQNSVDDAFSEQISTISNQSYIDNLIDQSTIRFPKRNVYVKKELVSTNGNYYYSLVCGADDDLNSWIKVDRNGRKRPYNLKWIHFYPSLNTLTYQLAFLRIAQTRISFVRYEAEFSNSFLLGKTQFEVKISLPKSNVKQSNIKLKFQNSDMGIIYIWYFFEGKNYKYVKEKHTTKEIFELFDEKFFGDEKFQRRFFKNHFEGFTYSGRLDNNDKGIDEYAKNHSYLVSIIEVDKTPFLVFQ